MNAIEKGKRGLKGTYREDHRAIILEQTAKAYAVEELQKVRAEVIEMTMGLTGKEAAMIFTVTSIDNRIRELKEVSK